MKSITKRLWCFKWPYVRSPVILRHIFRKSQAEVLPSLSKENICGVRLQKKCLVRLAKNVFVPNRNDKKDTIEFSSIESIPITVTWKWTTVGWSSFFGGLILSYIFGSSGSRSWNVKKLDLGCEKMYVSDKILLFHDKICKYIRTVHSRDLISWTIHSSIFLILSRPISFCPNAFSKF